MPCPEKIERNDEIMRLLFAGEKQEYVAKKFHITTTRVQQIRNRYYIRKFSHLDLNNKEEKING